MLEVAALLAERLIDSLGPEAGLGKRKQGDAPVEGGSRVARLREATNEANAKALSERGVARGRGVVVVAIKGSRRCEGLVACAGRVRVESGHA
jgi:hypothetical protein